MKFNIKNVAAFTAIAVASVAVSAQNTQSGYFVDDYTYRYQMNPAFGNSRGFVSMPGLANVNASVYGSLHLSSVIYNVNGKTTTFLNPGVSASEVMGNLNDNNRIGSDMKFTLLATGFKAFGGYNTVSINARTNIGIRVPRSIFSLLKEGVENRSYDISNFSATATAYAEIAFGHSHRITDEWTVGASMKFLVGGGNMTAKFNRAQLTLGENDWNIVSNAQIETSVKGLTYDVDYNDYSDGSRHEYVSGADVDGAGINGFGLGFDLGAVYKPKALNDFTFSLAVLDLGFIRWNNNMLATTHGDKTFNTDKYTFNVDDDAPNSFDNEWDKMKDALSALYELDDAGDQGSRTTVLAATVNTGVEYTFPLYRKLSFGLLNTTRIQGDYTWTDFRLSANIAPVKCLSASVNGSAGTFGMGFGWLLNLHCPGFNFFAGMDHTIGKVTKQPYLPLNSNASFNLGMNFLF